MKITDIPDPIVQNFFKVKAQLKHCFVLISNIEFLDSFCFDQWSLPVSDMKLFKEFRDIKQKLDEVIAVLDSECDRMVNKSDHMDAEYFSRMDRIKNAGKEDQQQE